MTSRHLGQLTWLGCSLSLAAPDLSWFDRVTLFTGLRVEPLASLDTPPVLAVLDDRHVLVNGADLRTFSSAGDMQAWLYLTVSDVLLSLSHFTVLHASCFVVDGRAILVSGPPWSGKSSWAFEATRRGIPILGDDQVCLRPQTGRIHALPRPLKKRILTDADKASASSNAVLGQLDDESVALEPLPPFDLEDREQGNPPGLILFLKRHSGPGIETSTLERFEATRALLDQIRCYSHKPLPDVARVCQMLSTIPKRCMSVGDGELVDAFDLAVKLFRTATTE